MREVFGMCADSAVGTMLVSGFAAADFELLIRRHTVKLVPSVPRSVEVVGLSSVKSASRVYRTVVVSG